MKEVGFDKWVNLDYLSTMNQNGSTGSAIKFFEQLIELGETELMLRKELVQALKGGTSSAAGRLQPTVSKPVQTAVKPQARKLIPKSPELEKFYQEIKDCTKCRLHEGRTKFVFGVGNPKAEVMFIGEAPGREEDLKGEPFVGRAGQLLDKIIASIGFTREEVYIANTVKCRPPENREPQPDEMETCHPYLLKQIEMIKPKIICCLGRVSGQYLLSTKEALGRLRGKIHHYNGIKLLVTYHPAALLRYPEYKKETWEDMKLLRKTYEELRKSG